MRETYDCLQRSQHVLGELEKAPIKGTQVRDARDVLEKTTTDLGKALAAHVQQREAVRECAARVRDATTAACEACTRGRARLVSEGVTLAPHATDERHTPAGVLARAAFLIARGSATGVRLAAVEASRDKLAQARVADADARSARRTASALHEEAQLAWQNAYAALRAAVEAVLRAENVRGKSLKSRLAAYFPRTARRSRPADSPAPTPAADAGKPAP